jgi:hypothetical protein
MANGFFDPSFRGSVNPLEAFKAGQDIVQQGKIRGLQESLGQTGDLQSPEFRELSAIDPDSAIKLKSLLKTDDQGLTAAFQDSAVFRSLLQADPTGQRGIQFLQNRIQTGESQNRDMFLTKGLLNTALQDPQAALREVDSFLSIPAQLKAQGPVSIQSSKILDDGTIIEVLSGGGRKVISPTGESLTGTAARDAVAASNKKVQDRKVEIKKLEQTIKRAQAKEGVVTAEQKLIQAGNIKRLGDLSGTSSGRSSAVKKAVKFKTALEKGEAFSGAGRRAAQFIPGVFTSQGQFDEEFNAFAEVAARQQLKASGEIRPTDADVQGMKNAMFGLGRDEAVNVQLLTDFIDDQNAQNEELDQLIDASKGGSLSTFTFTPQGTVTQQAPAVNVQELSDEDLFN